MSKIRYRKQDEELLKKTVRNFNAKIDRLIKKGINKSILPSKLSLKEERKSITTRQDFNNRINLYKRFSKRGAEEIVTVKYDKGTNYNTTKWAIKEFSRMQKSNKKRMDKELERVMNLDPEIQGVPISKLNKDRALYRDTVIELTRPIYNPSNFQRPKEFQSYFNFVKKQYDSGYYDKKADLYKENYLNKLHKMNASKELIKQIEGLPPDFIKEIYYRDQEMANIKFLYNPEDEDELLDLVQETWDLYTNKYYESYKVRTGKLR